MLGAPGGSGVVVVRDSEVQKGVNPGQPIRYPREQSRFEPITIANWIQQFYAAPVDFGGGVPGTQPRESGASVPMPHLH